MPTNRGGDHGGGPTPRNLTISAKAAAWVRAHTTQRGTRMKADAMSATVSSIFEQLAAGRALLIPTAAVAAAVPWLETARAQCVDVNAQRAIDNVIAAIWAATAAQAAEGKE